MPAERIEVRFPATLPGFRGAFDELVHALDARALQPGTRYGVELVFEEIVANIVRHGGRGTGVAPPAIAVSVEVADDAVVMTFDDDGPPFDPCAPAAARRTRAAALDEDDDGGLGLTLVKRAAKDMQYRRTPDAKNRLVVTLASTAGTQN